MATVGTARMSGGSAARTRAELHYHGEAPTGDGLPAIVVLDPEESVVEIGREDGCGILLDSPAQKLMISRLHATLSYDQVRGQWKVMDRDSLNGILHNGVKVKEQYLSDNDIITFGGAFSTIEGTSPGERAPKSIYVYKFVLQQDESASSSQQTPGRELKRGRPFAEDGHDGREGKRQQYAAQEDEERAAPGQQKMKRLEKKLKTAVAKIVQAKSFQMTSLRMVMRGNKMMKRKKSLRSRIKNLRKIPRIRMLQKE